MTRPILELERETIVRLQGELKEKDAEVKALAAEKDAEVKALLAEKDLLIKALTAENATLRSRLNRRGKRKRR
ncbi:MAG: hypothetical protein LUF35_03460 [Lachnospiraceae bacterium]|nr:hypothetical protein [Lachnospiraceae bacterium]